MNEIKIVLWIVVLVVAVLVGIAINKENVSLPNHALPLLVIANLFKDSQKMKPIDRKMLRHQRDVATKKLFKTMIWLVLVLALIGLAVSFYSGG